ncbi:MAG: ABC transporter substrate-binding protein [Candidatus Competibacteraceae bacterium]|jgi:arginine/ornithine transport system substrate-binding protein|nr:ABC transporter substrate-binding protein [Candidatus Competibacteraceae bacterium]
MKAKLFIVGVLLVALLGSNGVMAKEWTKVRIGVEGAYPPFSFVDPEGNLGGFDIDIANALCAAMKVECELIKSDWDGIIPSLSARKFDAIIASMSITEERKKAVDFTNKYYQTPARFVRKKGADHEITTEGLKGKTVGVQRATIHDSYLTDNHGDVVEIKRYGSQDEAYLDMGSGRLDLMLADSIAVLDGFLKTDEGKDFEFVGPELRDPQWFGEGAGIALRKGDDELREMFNKAIEAIRADGTYKTIQDKYFDFDVYGE